MNRKSFFRTLGVVSAGALLPKTALKAATAQGGVVCNLIPTETAGPFPLDLSANTFYFRKDVRETQTGVQFDLKLKILGLGNCGNMQNLRVNIWHCSRNGLYSGYSNGMNQGQAGLTYLRGYQITDANGEVEFTTVFPGWYNGRIAHIHFQVYVSSAYSAVSQLTFNIAEKNGIYAANPTLYTQGADPQTYSSDNIFSDGTAYQICTLTPNAATGGYNGYLEATIQGNGTTGVGHIEKENAKQFSLEQNYPNPFGAQTTIPFLLQYPADVKLYIHDLQGKKVAEITRPTLSAGRQQIHLNLSEMKLPTSNYVYQIEVKNQNGIYTEYKLMTAAGQ